MAKDATKTQESDPGSNVTQGFFLQAVSQMREANERLADVKEERNRLRKKLRADGITLGVLDEAIAQADSPRRDTRAHYDELNRYLSWLNVPMGTQASLFEDKAPEDIERMDWHAQGVTDGLNGKEGKAPDHCPAEHIQTYMDGYGQGQRKLAEAMPEKAKELAKKGNKDGSREKTPEPA